MKNRISMIAILISILSFATNTVKAQATDEKYQTVTIKTSAVCGSCEKTIETAVNQLNGIKEASLDVDSKILTVTFNTEKTTVEEIKNAVVMAGYDADEIPADAKAYENLHGCCKKDAHQ